MKATQIIAIFGFIAATAAQDPGPSPTASIGCEPHGDHWHCEAPAPAETSASGDDDHTHDHGDDESLHPDLPPAPTASIGCEPHGDHWHCEAPAPSETSASGDDDEHHDDDHTHDHGDDESVHPDLGPSPTASVGCEPHGDHYHCEGPRETDSVDESEVSESVSVGESASSTGNVEEPEESIPAAGAAGVTVGAGAAILAALLAF